MLGTKCRLAEREMSGEREGGQKEKANGEKEKEKENKDKQEECQQE